MMGSLGNVFALALIAVAGVAAAMALPAGKAFSQVIIEQRIGVSPEVSPAPSPVGKEYIPSSYERHLRTCIKKVPSGCGPKIFTYLFNETSTITSFCCQNMRSVGITCHKDLTRFIALIPEFKAKQEQILMKATKIFEQCIPPTAF